MDTIEARDIIKRMCKGDPTPIQLEALNIAYDILSIGLNPEQIMELKERDTAKTPEIHKNKHSNAYTCPNCGLVLINKDETGWFCGKHYKFCPDCGQRLWWEEL